MSTSSIHYNGTISLEKRNLLAYVHMYEHCTYNVHTVGELKDWTLHRASVVKPP